MLHISYLSLQIRYVSSSHFALWLMGQFYINCTNGCLCLLAYDWVWSVRGTEGYWRVGRWQDEGSYFPISCPAKSFEEGYILLPKSMAPIKWSCILWGFLAATSLVPSGLGSLSSQLLLDQDTAPASISSFNLCPHFLNNPFIKLLLIHFKGTVCFLLGSWHMASFTRKQRLRWSYNYKGLSGNYSCER